MVAYGYPRCSKPTQNIERQIRNIKAVCPSAIMFPEYYTGTTSERKQWQKLMKLVKAGDTIYFDSVSRMSRNAEEGFADYEALYYAGVELVFLKEPHINTAVFRKTSRQLIPMTNTDVDLILQGINKYLMQLAKNQIILAFEQAEKEVMDLRERTKEGIETARRSGKNLGRPAGKTYQTQKAASAKKDIRNLAREFGGNLMDKDVIRLLGINPKTYYKYKGELRKEQETQMQSAK